MRVLAFCFFWLLCLTGCRTSAPTPLRFATAVDSPTYPFAYADTATNDHLRELRATYALDELVRGATTDRERALRVLDWTHRQWSHNGSNTPSESDALTILEEAARGKQFRCVEYGIVSSSALAALGLPARVLSLKTKDVETTKYGAGHVLAEVWLADEGKWAMIDGQFNVMPVLDDRPLNAVELQRALAGGAAVTLVNAAGPVGEKQQCSYLSFVTDYLYYFNVSFDQRMLPDADDRITYRDKSGLMLVPEGAGEPTVFQRVSPIDYVVYTNNAGAFYPAVSE